MISYLKGAIRGLGEGAGSVTVITRSGIGYQVTLPVIVWKAIKDTDVADGDEIEFEIYYHVTDRQPKPVLVGFRTAAEKGFFEQLIEVEGIGPNKAAAALVLPVQTIASAIEREDLATLRRLPGIGDRAAQKMVATLRGKVAQWAIETADTVGIRQEAEPTLALNAREQAISALINLGHKPTEARNTVDDALGRRPELVDDPQELMREIFRSLAKAS